MSSALLMGVLRPRNSARKRSRSISSGSMPPASKSAACATLRRPKRRGSTKRSSLPEARRRMACVCFSTSACGLAHLQPSGHAQVDDPLAVDCVGRTLLSASASRVDEDASFDRFALFDPGFWRTGVSAPHCHLCSKSKTMCLPILRTAGDAALLQRGDDCRRGRFQRLFLLAEPDGFHDISGDALGQAAGDGFDFGKFGHGRKSLTTKDTKVHEGKPKCFSCVIFSGTFLSPVPGMPAAVAPACSSRSDRTTPPALPAACRRPAENEFRLRRPAP